MPKTHIYSSILREKEKKRKRKITGTEWGIQMPPPSPPPPSPPPPPLPPRFGIGNSNPWKIPTGKWKNRGHTVHFFVQTFACPQEAVWGSLGRWRVWGRGGEGGGYPIYFLALFCMFALAIAITPNCHSRHRCQFQWMNRCPWTAINWLRPTSKSHGHPPEVTLRRLPPRFRQTAACPAASPSHR